MIVIVADFVICLIIFIKCYCFDVVYCSRRDCMLVAGFNFSLTLLLNIGFEI